MVTKKYLKEKKSTEKFYSTPTSILSSKTFTDSQKLVLIVMMADLEMNEAVKWCQNTYADKTGKSRKFINTFMSLCVDKRLLIPSSKNKPGSKNNTYTLNTSMFDKLLQINNPRYFKPVTLEDKPVTPGDKPVTLEDRTCNQGLHI